MKGKGLKGEGGSEVTAETPPIWLGGRELFNQLNSFFHQKSLFSGGHMKGKT
jgi:hypothetical protein